MKNETATLDLKLKNVDEFKSAIKNKSDKLIDYFLAIYFVFGLYLSFYYDTFLIGIGVGTISILAYYSAKIFIKNSNLYQYVLSIVLGVFMAQYIYQMHGLFEMHFTAFIGSAILITYQNWKLQIPLALVVIIHHGLFGYLQYIGFDKIYFTQLDYMSLQAFIFHGVLASTIFLICGLWAYQFKKFSEEHLQLTYNLAKLEQKEIENEELKKTNYELDKFVYSVSHDLRSPLSSILGIVEFAKEDSTEEPVQEHLVMIEQSIKKLDGFILDILDYSRNARVGIVKEKIPLKPLLDDIINNIKHMSYTIRKVDIQVEGHENKFIYTDKTRLTIILNNLISNGIRYQNLNNNHPLVKIEVIKEDANTKIQINDNGIGIAEAEIPKIFDMFYRVSEKSIGSGLGLYIVKEAIDKINGKINVNSALGAGSKFLVEIPNE